MGPTLLNSDKLCFLECFEEFFSTDAALGKYRP
jgi:hypothetical protein